MTNSFHVLGQAEKLTIPSDFSYETRIQIMAAINDTRVSEATTLHEQIGWLCSILRPDGVGLSYEKIGTLFTPHKSHSTIKRHLESFTKDAKEPQRPNLLSEEQYQVLADKIRTTIAESGNPSLVNIISFINDAFEIQVSRQTAARILKRLGFKLVKARPIEEERYNCKIEDIIAYYQLLVEVLNEVPCGFCFNLDESGIQRYVDAKDTFLVVPESFSDAELTFPVYRAAKRITILHCISTDGRYVKPLFVLPRKTVDSDIFNYIDPNSCRFTSQENGFLTAELFKYWLHTCFFPELNQKRETFQYFGPACLIMDGFKGHTKAYEELKDIFAENNVKVIFIPAHSSDQIQPLDLLGFNLLKLAKNRSNISFEEGTSDQTREIVRIMNALQSVSTSVLITKAWHAAGILKKPVEEFSFDREVFIQYHSVDIEMAKKIRVQNEENKLRIKAFSENLIHSNKNDTERVFPNPKRLKTIEGLTPAQIEWFHKNRDDFVENPLFKH